MKSSTANNSNLLLAKRRQPIRLTQPPPRRHRLVSNLSGLDELAAFPAFYAGPGHFES